MKSKYTNKTGYIKASSILSKARVNYRIRLKRNEIVTAASIVNSTTMQMIITDNYILLTFKLKKEIQIIRIYLQGHNTQAAGLKEKKNNDNFLQLYFIIKLLMQIFDLCTTLCLTDFRKERVLFMQ